MAQGGKKGKRVALALEAKLLAPVAQVLSVAPYVPGLVEPPDQLAARLLVRRPRGWKPVLGQSTVGRPQLFGGTA